MTGIFPNPAGSEAFPATIRHQQPCNLLHVRTRTHFLFFERQAVKNHLSCVAPTSQSTLITLNTRGKPILGQTLEKSQYFFAITKGYHIYTRHKARQNVIHTGRMPIGCDKRKKYEGERRASRGPSWPPTFELPSSFDCIVPDSHASPVHAIACRRARLATPFYVAIRDYRILHGGSLNGRFSNFLPTSSDEPYIYMVV